MSWDSLDSRRVLIATTTKFSLGRVDKDENINMVVIVAEPDTFVGNVVGLFEASGRKLEVL